MSWWKRNSLALLAVAILAPVTIVSVAWHEWIDYFSGRPVFAIAPESDGTLDYAGSIFGPIIAETAEAAALGAPEGTTVLSVRMPVVPGEEGASCLPPVLREQGGQEREWNERSVSLAGVSMTTTSCLGDITSEPYEMELYYVLPEDAHRELALEVSSPDMLPGYASFSFELP